MSYCRWSSECHQCDVYVYEDVAGGWTIHVAGMARVNDEVPPVKWDGYDDSPEAFIKYWRACREWVDLPSTRLVDIDNPSAGESFYGIPSAGECANKLEELRDSGLNVPAYATDALREEEKTVDTTPPID